MRPQAVPAPEHGEEVRGERRAEDRIGLVDRDHTRCVQRLQDLPLDVARAVLRVREARRPTRSSTMSGSSSCSAMEDANRRKKRSASAFDLFVDQLEVEQRDPLAEIEAGFDRPHQQRALAHLARALDRQRLARLADDRERGGVGGPRQIPRDRRRRASLRGRAAAPHTAAAGSRSRSPPAGPARSRRSASCRRSRRAVPAAVAACPAVHSRRRTGWCRDRRSADTATAPSKSTRTGRMCGSEVVAAWCRASSISPRTISLRLDSAVRKTTRKSDCANLRLDLPRPRLADGQPLIDEDRVAGSGQAGDHSAPESGPARRSACS